MTRPPLSDILSGEQQSLQEVWEWHEFQRTLIGEERSRVLTAPVGAVSATTSRYVGKTREELEEDFAHQVAELARVTMLGLLASTEAALRVDFVERVWNKMKDPVSRRFLVINGGRFWKPFGGRGIRDIRLEEDILDTWREHGVNPAIKRAVAEFKGALNLRHWLAHGRYWKPSLGRPAGYDPADVFDICRELLQATGQMP